MTNHTLFVPCVTRHVPLAAKTWGIDTLLVSGLMTQYCSVTTARHAHDLDYRVVFVVDANAGPDLPDLGFGPVPHDEARRTIATSLAGGIAEVVDTGTVVAAIEEHAVTSA